MKKQVLLLTAVLASLLLNTAHAQTSPKQKPGKAAHGDSVKRGGKATPDEPKYTPRTKPEDKLKDQKKKKG